MSMCLFIIAVLAGFAAYSLFFKPMLDDAVASGAKNAFTDDARLSAIVMSVLAGAVGIITIIVLLVPTIKEQVYTIISAQVNTDTSI